MPAVLMEATMRQNYDGKAIKPGQTFSTTEADAADLVALNMARRKPVASVSAPAPTPAAKEQTAGVVLSRALKATEDATEGDQAPAQQGNVKKGEYARRDVRAAR